MSVGGGKYDFRNDEGEFLMPQMIAAGDVDDIIADLYHIGEDADVDALRRALVVAVGDLKSACREAGIRNSDIWNVSRNIIEYRDYVRSLGDVNNKYDPSFDSEEAERLCDTRARKTLDCLMNWARMNYYPDYDGAWLLKRG